MLLGHWVVTPVFDFFLDASLLGSSLLPGGTAPQLKIALLADASNEQPHKDGGVAGRF